MLKKQPVKKRRTQGDRSDEARSKAISAAVQLLVEGGFGAATTPAIALKAGMSRGRLTHQFPTKNALLVAICEHLTDLFIDSFALDLPAGTSVEQRVEAIVRQSAAIYLSDDYLALLHIFFGASGHPDLAKGLSVHSERISHQLPAIFCSAFADQDTSSPQLTLGFRMIVDLLRGMAIGRFLGRVGDHQQAELAQLVRDVTRIIESKEQEPTGQ